MNQISVAECSTVSRISRNEKFGLIALSSLAVIIRLKDLGAPLAGAHLFRMTQTAWGVRSFSRGNYSPFSIEMPVLGPPWKVPFEFPLYQMVAGTICKALGQSVEASSRLVSIFFFIVTGILVYVVCRMFFLAPASLVALSIFFFNGFNLEYGSAVLIDYCAVALGLGAFLAVLRFLASRKKPIFVMFLILGLLGALVKITTSVIWVGIGTLVACFLVSSTSFSRLAAVGGSICLHFPAILWTRWADHQKLRSPTTSWLTSESLKRWNFGSLSQRFSWHAWIDSAPSSILPSVMGIPVLALVLVLMGLALTRRGRSHAAFFLLLVSGPLIFTNLYIVHDYYWIAVLPALFVLVAAGLDSLFTLLKSAREFSRIRQFVVGLSIGAVFILGSWSTQHGQGHFDVWLYTGSAFFGDENERLAIETISNETEPSDKVVILGYDWNPRILYFADRKGLMIPPAVEPAFLRDSPDLGNLYKYVYLYVDFSPEQLESFFGTRQLEPVTGRLFRIPNA